MSRPLVALGLRWPREMEPDRVVSLWRMLAGVAGTPVVLEVTGHAGAVHHRIFVPEGREGIVVRQLRAAVPGVAVTTESVAERPPVDVVLDVRLSSRRRSLRDDDLLDSSRTVLHALSAVGGNEAVVLRLVLGKNLSPAAVPATDAVPTESWAASIFLALTGTGKPVDSEVRRALAQKRGEPGWRALGRLAVSAADPGRRRQVLRQVLGALRTLEGPDVRVYARAVPRWRLWDTSALRYPLRLNVRELAALSAVPVGTVGELPVPSAGSRRFPPSSAVAATGRVMAQATFPGQERPLALGARSALRHLWITGATGTGKSSAALALIEADMVAGRGLAVIEPKGDLIRDVLARVPDERRKDVVLIDPSAASDPSAHVVGVNPLAPMGRPPELVADQLLGIFHSVYAAHWGPRTADILGNALATLARVPGMSLPALPLLLSDPSFRRRVVGRLEDRIGLLPAWREFESWSPAQRDAAVAPSLNRLRPLLVNPMVRSVLGQSTPGFEPKEIFTKRRILLVNLAKGMIGPEASRILGSIVLTLLWQASLSRATIAPERRHPCFVYVDEFQDFLHLGYDLGDALSQSRGLGVGFVLCNQTATGQLDPQMRSVLLANVASRLCFSLSAEDARLLGPAGSGPSVEDFTTLGAFECYLRLLASDAVQPWCSAKTDPPSRPIRDPDEMAEASRRRYGRPRSEIDAAIEQLSTGARTDRDDLAPRRRGDGP